MAAAAQDTASMATAQDPPRIGAENNPIYIDFDKGEITPPEKQQPAAITTSTSTAPPEKPVPALYIPAASKRSILTPTPSTSINLPPPKTLFPTVFGSSTNSKPNLPSHAKEEQHVPYAHTLGAHLTLKESELNLRAKALDARAGALDLRERMFEAKQRRAIGESATITPSGSAGPVVSDEQAEISMWRRIARERAAELTSLRETRDNIMKADQKRIVEATELLSECQDIIEEWRESARREEAGYQFDERVRESGRLLRKLREWDRESEDEDEWDDDSEGSEDEDEDGRPRKRRRGEGGYSDEDEDEDEDEEDHYYY